MPEKHRWLSHFPYVHKNVFTFACKAQQYNFMLNARNVLQLSKARSLCFLYRLHILYKWYFALVGAWWLWRTSPQRSSPTEETSTQKMQEDISDKTWKARHNAPGTSQSLKNGKCFGGENSMTFCSWWFGFCCTSSVHRKGKICIHSQKYFEQIVWLILHPQLKKSTNRKATDIAKNGEKDNLNNYLQLIMMKAFCTICLAWSQIHISKTI